MPNENTKELIEKVLDAIADSYMNGYDFSREDDCYIFIRHVKDRKPCCRIRKDTAVIEMLNGQKFFDNNVPIGWRLPAADFLNILQASKPKEQPEPPPALPLSSPTAVDCRVSPYSYL